MNQKPEFICGLYASEAEAERTRNCLLENGIPARSVRIVPRVRAGDHCAQLDRADGLLKDIVVDSALGAVAGGALGLLGQAALVAANVTLFVASPVVAPLAMIGWGAALGGLVGGAAGANGPKIRGSVADVVLYGIRHGHVTLVVQVADEAEQSAAVACVKNALIKNHQRRTAGDHAIAKSSSLAH